MDTISPSNLLQQISKSLEKYPYFINVYSDYTGSNLIEKIFNHMLDIYHIDETLETSVILKYFKYHILLNVLQCIKSLISFTNPPTLGNYYTYAILTDNMYTNDSNISLALSLTQRFIDTRDKKIPEELISYSQFIDIPRIKLTDTEMTAVKTMIGSKRNIYYNVFMNFLYDITELLDQPIFFRDITVKEVNDILTSGWFHMIMEAVIIKE